MNTLESIVIRRANASDATAVERLAALDSAETPGGPLLVAESGHELVAALPLAGGRPVADPFRPTAGLVSMLQLRAAHLR